MELATFVFELFSSWEWWIKLGRDLIIKYIYKIMNGLAKVPFEDILVRCIREQEENTMRNSDILVIQLASMVNGFPQTY